MSHEIRTPMNAVIGMTGLLLDTELDPQQRSFAEIVRSSGEALLSLINDILDFSKIEAGELTIERAPMSVREVVENSVEVVAIAAVKRGIELSFLIDPEVPLAIRCDAIRIQQTLVNLLSNAVKFTSEGEVAVTVTSSARAESEDHEVHFAVRDTGIGIAEDKIATLFDAFTQEDASTTRRFGGTGLGLTICKRLVEAMGGRIWIESTQGIGSTFHFTIVGASAPRVRPSYLEAEQPQLAGARVLVVDDNSTNRRILKLQLESWGMRPTLTSSGFAALELLEAGDEFDCAVFDMHMPGMNGLELAARARALPSGAALPLVMLTSLGERDKSETMAEFAAFLTKPVKTSRLYNVLLSLFEGAPRRDARVDDDASAGDGEAEDLPARLRILVAEDNSINQQVALLSLARLGYRAALVSNGLEAIAALDEVDYDVVLMDVHMPELDGLSATRRIRAERQARQPYIVAVTANATVQDREQCLAAGMDDYVSKPFRVRDLRLVLSRYAERRRGRAAHDASEARADPTRAGVDSSASPVDPAAFADIKELLDTDDDAQVSAMLDEFLPDVAALVSEVEAAVREDDRGALKTAAHTLKSNSATVGARELRELAFALETAAGRNNAQAGATIVALGERLAPTYRRYLAALEQARASW